MKQLKNHRLASSGKLWMVAPGLILLCCRASALAQSPVYYGQGFFGIAPGQIKTVQPAFAQIGKNVVAVNKLAAEIKWRYGWELQKCSDSPDCQALFTHMTAFCASSEALMKAYKQQDRPAFTAAAKKLQVSFSMIETMQEKVRLSAPITALINQSKPMVGMIADQAETCILGQ